jgi:C-terminal processing protease CtpA/Prc
MEHEHLIPVNIEWRRDTAFVTYNYTDDINLSPGTIVTEINGVSIDVIYRQCLSVIPNDGYSKSYAKFWVNNQFFYYYHLMFGMYENYNFSTRSSQDQSNEVSTTGMSVSEMNNVELSKPLIVDELIEGADYYFIDDMNTAVLRVGSFFNSDYRSLHKKRYKKVIDENIQKILDSNCEYLILDLRANDGGQPSNPLYLLKHLMNAPFEFKHEVRTLRDKNESDSFKRSKKTRIPDRQVGIFEPFESSFKGTIYLIVDGGATSAAAEFASVFQRYSRGKIIGTETGGNPIILTGYGLSSSQKLPNTKLTFGVGTRTTLMNDENLDTGYGLIPDVVIEPIIKDYFNGNNPSLEYILGEIKAIQRNP